MSNIIQIKRGNGKPDGKLAPYELGVQINDGNKLFIGGALNEDGTYGDAQQIKVENAENAINAENASKLNNVEASEYILKSQIIGENATEKVQNSINADEAINASRAKNANYANRATNAENANKIKNSNNEYITFVDMLNLIYPIGSIYISVNDIDPTGLFGGTWEQLTETFLFAASTIGKSNPTYPANGNSYNTAKNGEATHTLTVKEIPSHRHTISRISKQVESGTSYSRITLDGTELSYTNYTGGDENGNTVPHNNMPPYLTVYMWKRIA